MIILVVFAFLAGLVTVLSPCILPILPIILSSGLTDTEKDSRRPLGIILGFVLSFTFFTLFLSSIVSVTGISADSLRIFSIVVIFSFGISLLVPRFQQLLEILFSKFAQYVPSNQSSSGFLSGILVGMSLGLLWTPCVGPILASVISLAISGTVTSQAFFITLAYSLGTAIPMLLIIRFGRSLFQKVPWLLKNTVNIQKGFGVVMILVSLAIYTNLDRRFQEYILNKFPNYGTGLTKIESNKLVQEKLSTIAVSQKGELAPDLIAGGSWVNSTPLTIAQLRGKVVLVDFWTYTCINCIRTLPYLREWYQKYSDKGLVIIGVHTPEFEFEKKLDNLTKATKDFNLLYPIMQDNNFATWRAYNNRYWPAKYLIDKDGYIKYTHFGEGDYDITEQKIQELLREAGKNIEEKVTEITKEKNFAKTPETYLGYGRGGAEDLNRANYEKYAFFSYSKQINSNQVGFQGNWLFSREFAQSSQNSEITINFSAKDVYLVMSPEGKTSTVEVYLDDKFVKTVEVTENKLYQLLNMATDSNHLLKIKFIKGITKAFAFTFG